MSADEARKERLQRFVSWVAENRVGDEKSHAQIFLDRLFQAFGRPGALEVGGQPEFRIRKAADDGGGTAFADYVWKPVVLIEMKRRGADLSKCYRQAFDYWTRLVPGRPRYVVLCNFDEIWIYDFENQLDDPVDRLALAELPERYAPLAFLFVTNEKPIFGNDHVAVTRQAADCLADCFKRLMARRVDRALAQRFVLQMLVALFSEDIGLLERYFVTRLLEECKAPADSYDLLGGLFAEMNSPGRTSGGRYKGVDYFNGGIFREPARLELYDDELNQLRAAAKSDWSKVRPEIFGAIFEYSLEIPERRALGAHFTNPIDIMKIVGPTIVEPWREQIDGARTLKRLGELHERMLGYTVLDPACGSGNFLYVAYREMKRLEARLLERIGEMSKRDRQGEMRLPFVTARNFHGIDINPFAVELAKVTLAIARKLAEDELHIGENALPLDNLDANFTAGDALIDAHGHCASWPRADVIVGNPPFGGAKLLKPQHGAKYVNALRAAYPDVPGMADYCVYWFRRAHDHLAACTPEDPVAGRAGLVGTQNVRNNQSRVGGLDHIVATGTVVEAVDNQPWSGEANVHVSIVNWVKTQDAALLPEKRVLWTAVAAEARTPRRRGCGPAEKEYGLVKHECGFVNSALSDKTDVTSARILVCNAEPRQSFNGQMLGHDAFLLLPEERNAIVKRDPKSARVIHPYLNGREALAGSGIPERYVLDFGQMDQLEAASYRGAFDWVRRKVLPDRMKKVEIGRDGQDRVRPHHKAFLSRWWQLSFGRPELLSHIARIPRYLCCSLVTKRSIFLFVDSLVRPSNLLQVFTFADDYTFGVLQSCVHWVWFVQNSSKLKSDYRFGENVWNTFPWPQSPNSTRVEAVVRAGREVRHVRCKAAAEIEGGFRAVYRMLELPGKNPLKNAHAELDAAVLAAYGFSPRKDLLAQLLDMNLEVARRIDEGKPVTGPGVPPDYPDPDSLVTDDCLRPIE